ncbi:hypothetical protein BJY04DRAFT_218921 [Aspergillus karnatakaensis]|uniref:uncharacterized protein n=1 Tax=Aspergillus karnatakaensis TaxID=1810916 RepID=UPI003CCE1FEC
MPTNTQNDLKPAEWAHPRISSLSPVVRVATLRQHHGHSSVTYHDLNSSRPIAGVCGYSFLSGIADQDEGGKKLKQYRRMVQAYAKIHSLLQPDSPAIESPSSKTTAMHMKWKPERCPCALIERLEPPPGTKSDVVTTVFARIDLALRQRYADKYLDAGPQLPAQFINCRSSNIKASDLNSPRRPIIISTGMCLFSSRLLGFILSVS